MPRTILVVAALAALAAPAARAADGWGLENERTLELSGEVVDLLCAVTGDCPADCGGGRRQLGIVTADGRLYPAVKGTVFFAGAAPDLLPYCGHAVQADGLLIENPAMTLYFAQSLKATPEANWAPTDVFLTQWTAAHGPAEEWWRIDPTVKGVIDRDGLFGIPGLKPE